VVGARGTGESENAISSKVSSTLRIIGRALPRGAMHSL
jgi:hypothetical protein